MWLINTKTLTLEEIHNPSAVKYAILSHTWEKEEVSFQDMAYLPKAKGRAGFAKIARACEMALEKEGLGYAWVDTCCIDKTSSAELSEAINSMFQWYKQADVCFVFLSDLSPQTKPQPSVRWPFHKAPEDAAILSSCKWFSRGWTLQELIAPTYVKFYDASWQYRFTKDGEASTLSAITRIDYNILTFKKELTSVPVAVKMSWASRRETTRIEDRAYSLLGLFDINMPMLYGEGHRAFQRLQEEIVKETDDLSLFAWLAASSSKQPYRGAFAASPSEFAHCATLKQKSSMDIILTPFSITNRGISFQAVVFVSMPEDRFYIDLGCRTDGICWSCGTEHVIRIGLQHTADGWVRKSPTECWLIKKPATFSREREICIRKQVSWERSKVISKFPTHSFRVNFDLETDGRRIMVSPQHYWNPISRSFAGEAFQEDFVATLIIPVAQPAHHRLMLWLVKYLNGREVVVLGMQPHPDWEIVEGHIPENEGNFHRREHILERYRHGTFEAGVNADSQWRVRIMNRIAEPGNVTEKKVDMSDD
ncbi:het domain-containing protein [Colletotrichum incanum]|uniref:Het domain-containing protein n=1 Tax=Colletotrichum incanum TaxID=1573173 RepID=A0A161WFQ5_COLIC|nr:het domain-containing protein [Colletotrichum incanum]